MWKSINQKVKLKILRKSINGVIRVEENMYCNLMNNSPLIDAFREMSRDRRIAVRYGLSLQLQLSQKYIDCLPIIFMELDDTNSHTLEGNF